MGRLDADGRLSNRSTVDALGWTAGDCLNIALVEAPSWSTAMPPVRS